MSPSQTREEGNRLEQLSSLASAVLILNLSEMTGVCYFILFTVNTDMSRKRVIQPNAR